jgi:uncharacterized protein
MDCPNDGATLVMSERSGIEIDYCPECRGIWLDRGELDKLIERSYQQPPAPYGEQPYGQHQPHGHAPHGQPPHAQPAGYGQPGGHGRPAGPGHGGSDTVGRLADKALRMVQQRAGGQRGYDQRGYDQRGYDARYDQRGRDQRGGRSSWLGDILG